MSAIEAALLNSGSRWSPPQGARSPTWTPIGRGQPRRMAGARNFEAAGWRRRISCRQNMREGLQGNRRQSRSTASFKTRHLQLQSPEPGWNRKDCRSRNAWKDAQRSVNAEAQSVPFDVGRPRNTGDRSLAHPCQPRIGNQGRAGAGSMWKHSSIRAEDLARGGKKPRALSRHAARGVAGCGPRKAQLEQRVPSRPWCPKIIPIAQVGASPTSGRSGAGISDDHAGRNRGSRRSGTASGRGPADIADVARAEFRAQNRRTPGGPAPRGPPKGARERP